MEHHWGGLVELFVVFLFVVGWGVLELVTLRLDKRRKARTSEESTGHPER